MAGFFTSFGRPGGNMKREPLGSIHVLLPNPSAAGWQLRARAARVLTGLRNGDSSDARETWGGMAGKREEGPERCLAQTER